MDLPIATKLFPSIEKFVFENIENAFYVAIVKNDLTVKESDDYYFEIRHGNKTSNIGLLKSFKDRIDDLVQKFPNIEEDIDIKYEERILLQNTQNKQYGIPFVSKVDKPNGGCSVSNNKFMFRSGTLGGLFKLEKDDATYFISNFHVLANWNSDRFESVNHPSNQDVNNVKPYVNYNPMATLYWFVVNEHIDAAIARINCESNIGSGFRENSQFQVKEIIEPRIGMKVVKFGRTTGFTKGVIRSIKCSVKISDNRIAEDNQSYRIFRNQILTNCMSLPGDSGSLLMTVNGNPVGLTFAGNEKSATIHNNLNYIFDSPRVKFNGIYMPKLELNKFI